MSATTAKWLSSLKWLRGEDLKQVAPVRRFRSFKGQRHYSG